ncbi:MAG: T9SS type A sorting domain-containing protein [Daejeonella sp.]
MYTVSDGRFKSNVSEDDVKGLDFIKHLRPVVYNFNTKLFNETLTKHLPDSLKKASEVIDFSASTAIRQSGFIAQEVAEAAKKSGYDFNGVHQQEKEKDTDYYSLSYAQFVVPLVKAVQEQEQKIEEQEKTNEQQQKTIGQLQQQLEELKELVMALNNTVAETAKTTSIKTGNPAKGLEGSVSGDIKIYPNPSKGLVTVNTSRLDSGEIEVFNLTGTSVQKMSMRSNVFEYRLDLSNQPRGIFLVRISSKGQVMSTQKIVLE